MKDRYQKQKLLQYFLSKDWYPQLEVDVTYSGSTSPKPKMITDIDVFAMAPESNGILSPIIGDCKTLKNQSPINRVFWIKGVMEHFCSNFGVVLLSKNIEGEHKLLASDLGVSLLSDDDFKVYSIATSNSNLASSAALVSMECWDRYFDLPNRFPKLETLFWYCKSGYWNEENFGVKLRHCISRLRAVRQELNPDNRINVFVFLELASLFAIAINELSIKIFNKFLLPKDKDEFDRELKILVWGGYENYVFWNELRNRLVTNPNEPTGLSLPEWPMFVQLVRNCIEKPLSTAIIPLILKEVAFQFLVEQQNLNIRTEYLESLLKRDPIASKNAIMIIDYLVKGAKLPVEFSSLPDNLLMKLQRNQL